MVRSYTLGTPNATRDNTNKMSSLKNVGKYLTSSPSSMSKSIEARSDLDLFLEFVCFNASTTFKPMDD